MEYIGLIVQFNKDELDVLGDRKFEEESIKYFIDCVIYSENNFDSNISLIINKYPSTMFFLLNELNILFNKARLLKSYPNIRERYLSLIKKYLPYVRYLTKEDYLEIINNNFQLIEECYSNIPSMKGDIQTLLIKYRKESNYTNNLFRDDIDIKFNFWNISKIKI
jgi:hypothetical protein